MSYELVPLTLPWTLWAPGFVACYLCGRMTGAAIVDALRRRRARRMSPT